jgi:hypothetical protein
VSAAGSVVPPTEPNGDSVMLTGSRKAMHDANNQLSIIIGNVEILACELGPDSAHQARLTAIIRAARQLVAVFQP